MNTHLQLGLAASAAVAGICLSGISLATPAADFASSGEQLEADYRVIAARCGTPAFEKAFFKSSRAAVAAGLVAKGRDPVQVEKTITSLRRSPFVLVAASADCPAQLERLKEIQKIRASARGKPRVSHAK